MVKKYLAVEVREAFYIYETILLPDLRDEK